MRLPHDSLCFPFWTVLRLGAAAPSFVFRRPIPPLSNRVLPFGNLIRSFWNSSRKESLVKDKGDWAHDSNKQVLTKPFTLFFITFILSESRNSCSFFSKASILESFSSIFRRQSPLDAKMMLVISLWKGSLSSPCPSFKKNQELLACLEAKRAAVDDFCSFNLDSSDSKSPAIPLCRVGKLIHRCKWFISIYLNTGRCSLGQDASCEGSHHSPPARCFWRARRAFYTVQVTFAWIIA